MVLAHKMIMGMVPAKASLDQIVKVQDQHSLQMERILMWTEQIIYFNLQPMTTVTVTLMSTNKQIKSNQQLNKKIALEKIYQYQ